MSNDHANTVVEKTIYLDGLASRSMAIHYLKKYFIDSYMIEMTLSKKDRLVPLPKTWSLQSD